MSDLNSQSNAYFTAGNDNVYYNQLPPPPPYSATEPAVLTVPTVTAITQQPVVHGTVVVQPPVKLNPTHYTCPSCHKRIITRVIYGNTRKTHVAAGFIFGFTFWCCLCCLAAIPYLIPTFRKAHHYCPSCNVLIGTYTD